MTNRSPPPWARAGNRLNSALLLPTLGDGKTESLFLPRFSSPFLVSPLSGAVWNFPAAKRGEITLSVYLPGGGLRVSLLDHWRNPADETVGEEAPVSAVLTGEALGHSADRPAFSEVRLSFDCEKGVAVLSYGETGQTLPLSAAVPYGLCDLHLQCAALFEDPDGSYISSIRYRGQ